MHATINSGVWSSKVSLGLFLNKQASMIDELIHAVSRPSLAYYINFLTRQLVGTFILLLSLTEYFHEDTVLSFLVSAVVLGTACPS